VLAGVELLDRFDVDRIGICQLCLLFVSEPLGEGDLRAAKRAARHMAPVLWDEGLAEPALAALRERLERVSMEPFRLSSISNVTPVGARPPTRSFCTLPDSSIAAASGAWSCFGSLANGCPPDPAWN
jgi:hypothetical protein